MKNRIHIQFNEARKLQLPIKHVMKSSLATWPDIAAPSVLQVAAHADEFIATHPEFVVPLSQEMPFADLMMNPEKVEAVLKTAEVGAKAGGRSATAHRSNIVGRMFKNSDRLIAKKNP